MVINIGLMTNADSWPRFRAMSALALHRILQRSQEQEFLSISTFYFPTGILILTLTRADVGFELSLIPQSEQIC